MYSTPRKKKRNSSRVNLVASFVFHALVVAALVYFAAREGMLGKQMKKFAVEMVAKEKKVEKPKEPEKPKEQKMDEPKTVKAELPKPTAAPGPRMAAAPPPSSAAPPPASAAPPAATVPAFDFEGGKMVDTTSDPNVIYKNYVEYTLRSRWNRPDGIDDTAFIAEVEMAVASDGQVTAADWKRGSGEPKWDASVRQAVASVKAISRKPPTGFPPRFLVRFDVQAAEQQPVQLGVP